MIRRFCIAIVISTLLTTTLTSTPSAAAQAIFVDINAAQGGDGSSASPFRTLDEALAIASPGDSIRIRPGAYPSARIQDFAGTPERPIRIEATAPGVVFQDPALNRRYAILLRRVAHVHLDGLETRRGIAGVMVQESDHITIESMRIIGTGQEGIHIQDGSHDVAILSNFIADTGNRTDKVGNFPIGRAPGEGIYLGNGNSGGTDRVWNIRIVGNEITQTTHEAIDVKTPSHDIEITDNYIHDISTFVTGAVVFHINGHRTPQANISFERNIVDGVRTTSQYRDGNCLVTGAAATIQNNVFANCQHRGVYVENSFASPGDRDVSIVHNTFFRAGTPIEVRSGSPATVMSRNNLGTATPGNRAASSSDFVSSAIGDFRLAPTSGAIDRAGPVAGITTDFTGAARVAGPMADFGAFEYAATPASTPSSEPVSETPASTTTQPTTTTVQVPQRNEQPTTTQPLVTPETVVAGRGPTQAPPPTTTELPPAAVGGEVANTPPPSSTSTTSQPTPTTSTPQNNPNPEQEATKHAIERQVGPGADESAPADQNDVVADMLPDTEDAPIGDADADPPASLALEDRSADEAAVDEVGALETPTSFGSGLKLTLAVVIAGLAVGGVGLAFNHTTASAGVGRRRR